MTVSLRVHLALLFVQVSFGAWHVFGKYLLRYLDPLVLADFRVLGAMPLFLGAALVIDRRVPQRRDLAWMALLGLLGVTANQLLFINGLKHTNATNAGILMPSVPIFTTAMAAVMGIERIHGLKVWGVALAVIGALVMLDVSRIELGGGPMFGNMLLLGNCLCYATFMVLQRPLLLRIRPLTVMAGAYFFGGIAVLVIAAPALFAADLSHLPPLAWFGVAFAVLIPTTLNYMLISWAIKHSSTSLVATYTTLQPVTSAVLAAIFLGERAGLREALGFVLIALGLFLVSRARGGDLGGPQPVMAE